MLARHFPSIRYVAATALALAALLFYFAFFHIDTQPPVHGIRSSFDWGKIQPFNPPEPPIASLPQSKPHRLRQVQHSFHRQSWLQAAKNARRRKAVKASFQRCWTSYRTHAWMRDELQPISGNGTNTFGGFAATLVDSLDTLWILGMKKEFRHAVEAAASLDWADTPETAINLFETTIRHLGGLLSAYDLSKEPVLLEKSIELGNLLYAGFDTPNRMPGFWLDFEKAKTGRLVAGDHEPSATPGSMSMEFTRLSQLTGDAKYYDAISRVTNLLAANQNATLLPGMFPMFFDMKDSIVTADNSFSLGALADSLYEYFPKMYSLLGGLDPVYERLYRGSMEAVKDHLLFRPMTPNGDDVLFSGTAHVNNGNVELYKETQHLSCFAGGMFALGGKLFDIPEHVAIGARLARGCAWAYESFEHGMMPEILGLSTCETLGGCFWDEDRWRSDMGSNKHESRNLPKGVQHARDPKYILRPEAIESLFVLYRITGEEQLRDTAWHMFESIQKATETPLGNAAIVDITADELEQADSMESFWLAETLKYFYLIFSPPDVMSLDEYVFNTEAHPFLIPRD